MISVLRKHFWGFCIGIVIGIFFIIPQIFFQLSLNKDFNGVYRIINDDELYYMARAHEIVDGHYFIGNPFFVENKSSPSMLSFLPDFLAAFPAKIFSINVYLLFEIYDFILPSILFILGYFIFYLICEDKFWSIIFTCWFFLILYFNKFNRPISPQFIFIPVLTLILLLGFILIRQNRNRRLVILAGINFGLLFYFFTYFWTFFFILFSLLQIYYFFKKNFVLFKNYLNIFIIGLFFGVFYFFQIFQILKFNSFSETINRWAIHSRFPSGFNMVLPALIIVVIFLLYWRNKDLSFELKYFKSFLFFAVLTSIIAVNQHLITAKYVLFSSHYEIISYIFIFLASYYLLFRSKLLRNILTKPMAKIIIVFIMVLKFIPIFIDSISFDYDKELKRQRFAIILNWLNSSTEKDSVIFSNRELSNMIPSYTHNNVLFGDGAWLSFISDNEMLDRFVLNNYWQKNFNRDFVINNFNSIYGEGCDSRAGKANQLNKLRGLLGKPIINVASIRYPEYLIKRVIDYHNSMSEIEWKNRLKKYRIDYFIVGNLNGSFLSIQKAIDNLDNVVKLKEIGDFVVYKINFKKSI